MDTDHSHPPAISWHSVQCQAGCDDAGDRAAGLGRWWLARTGGGIVLSKVAARFLGVAPTPDPATWLQCIDPADHAAVCAALKRIVAGDDGADCTFRVRHGDQDLRWLRLQPVETLDGGDIVAGILVDITAARHAATRERFNFALTQYLIGNDGIDEAIVKILRLVCEELGWEWGAFWALEEGGSAGDERPVLLRCRYYWHVSRPTLAPFREASASLAVRPGYGLVEAVWSDCVARWIEDAGVEPGFVRAAAARASGLQSAYFFPVTFTASDGRLVRPGVLEFFSAHQRQRDAQLPGLATSISAMIAQAVERMTQQERIRLRAQTDDMTGLANRGHFHDLLDAMCDSASGSDTFGVLYVDLDQFKPINDVHGHDAGNVVLTAFAERLRALAPPGWRIGRLGGDEFALLSTLGADGAALQRVAAAVLEAARQPFPYQAHQLTLSASVGIALHPLHGRSTHALLQVADAAMYISKRSSRC